MQTIPWQSQSSDRPDGITVLDHSRGLVVRVRTNVTVQNSAALRAEVLSAWEASGNPPRIVLDLTGVHHIDSSGVGALMSLAQKANEAKVPFVLCGLQEGPRRMLQRTGLGKIFRTSESVEEALLGVSVQGVGQPDPAGEPPKVAPEYPASTPAWHSAAVMEPPPAHTHSHTSLWTVVGIILGALLAAGLWAWWAVGTYRGSLDLVPAMHDDLAAAGKRLDVVEAALKDWNTQRDAWAQRLAAIDGRLDGVINAARKQAKIVTARSQQRMQADLDRRTGSLQARLDAVQSAQKAADARVAGLQSQLQRTQSYNQQELSRLREDLGRQGDVHTTGLANLDQRVGTLDQQTGESSRQLDAVRNKLARDRVDFELGVHHNREIAPGITLDVSHTDVLHQRYDGYVWLMPDRRTLWVRSQGLQKPLVFYSQADDRPRELVVTRVTKNSIIGYLLLPPDKQTASAPSGGSR